MYITNLIHLLENKMNFSGKLRKEAEVLADFLPQVIDHTTRSKYSSLTPTGIHCFRKGCHGIINSALRPDTEEIHWYCPVCENEGLIKGWKDSEWDKTGRN